MSIPESLLKNTSVQLVTDISDIDAADWNALIPDNYPFIKHQFLLALEQHQCVGEHYGWLPRHLIVTQQDKLIAALPLYEKHNYYGEFVFDQAWENAWRQVGLPYYPKLVSAMPYTPAHGPRLLIDQQHPQANHLLALLVNAAQSLCVQQQNSGVHFLFANTDQQQALKQQPDLLHRKGTQFHWFNDNYQSFDDFLANLSAKKRKNIRQERKAIANSEIEMVILNGHTASNQDWEDFGQMYEKTFVEKWSTPTLNTEFFKAVAKTLPEQVVLVMAQKNQQNIAGALMFRSDTHLFGRHWGCVEEVKHLHFETCFYQGIYYAIEHQLQVFEPGAGGEHKIARGFVPVESYSSHWLAQNPFPEGIARFINEEAKMIDAYMEDCLQHSPYRIEKT